MRLLYFAIVIFLVAEDLFHSGPKDFDLNFSLQQDDQCPAVFTDFRSQMQIRFFEISIS